MHAMTRNIEIKAGVNDLPALAAQIAALADSGPIEIFQDDTFFACPDGRLKLRMFDATRGELIYYRRPDQTGPKTSFYRIAPTASPDALRKVLTLAHGQTGRVIKQRTLYLIGRTRAHLDRVEQLGTFMELEVVLGDDESTEAGQQEAAALMQRLGIQPDQLIDRAYTDLLDQLDSGGAASSLD
jgi:predicted adenylyl cyclase CyaB